MKSKFNNRENEKIISKDGREFWISRSVAVVGVIMGFEDSSYKPSSCKILTVKRGKKVDNSKKFCLPCGYLDWDESGEEAIKRELWEETNLDVSSLIQNTNHFYSLRKEWKVETHPENDAKQNVVLYYGMMFDFKDGLPDVSNNNAEKGEIDSVQWISIDEIKKFNWAFNHDSIISEFNTFMHYQLMV